MKIRAWERRLLRASVRAGHQLLYTLRSGLTRKVLREPPVAPPIFILGCGHSGTTILLTILSRSARIHCIPYETEFLAQPVWEVEAFVPRFNRDTLDAGMTRWAEKTPRHILHLAKLLRLFPDARVILMLRDGRDVACSLRARTGDLAAGVRRWVDDNAAGEPFWSDSRVRVLKYESLVADPARELAALMAFLGEAFDNSMLDHENGAFRFYGPLKTADVYKPAIDRQAEKPKQVSGDDHILHRSWQARQPIFDGRGRWRVELTQEDRELFKRVGGDMLIRYGYERGPDW